MWLAWAGSLVALIPVAAQGEFRHALVIGQASYKSGALDTPARDASNVATALERRGFTVARAENLATPKELDAALKAFAQDIPTNGTALVYFAGQASAMSIKVGAAAPKTDVGLRTLDGAEHPLNALLGPLVMPQYSPFSPEGRARGIAEWSKLGRQSGSRINIVILDTVPPPSQAPANLPAAPDGPSIRSASSDLPASVEHLPDSLIIYRSAIMSSTATAPPAHQAGAPGTPLAERFIAGLASERSLDVELAGLSPLMTNTLNDGELVRLGGPLSRAVSPPDKLAAGPGPGAEWVDRNGIVFCWCPPGEFMLGGAPSDPARQTDELPAQVAFSTGFWMAKHELTYRDCIPLGSVFHLATGDHKLKPINNLNRSAFAAFFRRLNESAPEGWQYGLPTEAEWQYAAQAGTDTAYSFGTNPAALARFGNFADKSLRDSQSFGELAKHWPSRGQAPLFGNRQTGLWSHAHPAWNDGAIGPCRVGSYPPNPWGLCDIHGNVAELTSTLYDPWRVAPVLSTAEMDEWLRRHENRWYFQGLVSKGGSWASTPDYCRSAFRGYERGTDAIVGMRLVLRPAASVVSPPPTRWTTLPVSSFSSASGATATATGVDGTLVVSGPIVVGDTYTIVCPVPAGLAPREVRLECLTDATLPKTGPGRATNGSFAIAEVSIAAVRGQDPAVDLEVLEVRSDHPGDKRSLIPRSASSNLVDGRPETIRNGLDGKNRELFFMIALPSFTGHDGARWRYPVAQDSRGQPANPATLVITIQNAKSSAAPLGKFRLSVLHDDPPASRVEASP